MTEPTTEHTLTEDQYDIAHECFRYTNLDHPVMQVLLKLHYELLQPPVSKHE